MHNQSHYYIGERVGNIYFMRQKMKKILVLIGLLFCSISNACDSDKEIEIKDSWVRANMGRSHMTAAYMNIKNKSDEADVLYKVTSKSADKLELHKVVTDDKGVSQMVHIDKIAIPAGQEVKLAPKGLHIMLVGLKNELVVGENIKMTLYFEKVGAIKLELPVKDLNTADAKE